MKIKTQFLLSIAVAVLMVLGATATVVLAVGNLERAEAAQAHAEASAREAAGLLALTQDFARTQEPQAAQQWWQRQAAIQDELVGAGDGGRCRSCSSD